MRMCFLILVKLVPYFYLLKLYCVMRKNQFYHTLLLKLSLSVKKDIIKTLHNLSLITSNNGQNFQIQMKLLAKNCL